VKRLAPDVVIIYHAVNDLSDNSYYLAKRRGLTEGRTEQTLSWPAKYSLLWYLAEKNMQILGRRADARNPQGKLKFDPVDLAKPFRSNLLSLVRASREVAEQAVLVTFSHRLRRNQTLLEQAEAAATNLYYMPYMSIEGLLDAFDAYNHVIRAVAAETNALLVDNENNIPGDSTHFRDSVHFSDVGSHAMAKRVVAVLLNSEEFTELVQRRAGAARD
jgi:lysophospholipase L1-like esterase